MIRAQKLYWSTTVSHAEHKTASNTRIDKVEIKIHETTEKWSIFEFCTLNLWKNTVTKYSQPFKVKVL